MITNFWPVNARASIFLYPQMVQGKDPSGREVITGTCILGQKTTSLCADEFEKDGM